MNSADFITSVVLFRNPWLGPGPHPVHTVYLVARDMVAAATGGVMRS